MPLGVDKQYMKADAVTLSPGSPTGLLAKPFAELPLCSDSCGAVEGEDNEAPVIRGYGLNGKTSSQCLYTREPRVKLAS